MGVSVVQLPATIVSVGLKLAGDVASFGAAQREALRTALKASLSCEEPACFLSLRVQAGSIDVTSILTIPQASTAAPRGVTAHTATPAATIATVQAAASTLVTSPPASISSTLGVEVTSANPNVDTQANVVVPLAVAPPPPSPPPSPLPFSPPHLPPILQTAAVPSPPSTALGDDALQAQSASEDGADSTMGPTMGIVGASAGSLLLILLAAGYYNLCRRTERNRSSVVITNVASSSSAVDDAEAEAGHCSDTGPKGLPSASPAASAAATSSGNDAYTSCLTSEAQVPSLSQQECSGGGYGRLGLLIDHSTVGLSDEVNLETEHKKVKARLVAYELAFAQENGGRKPRKPSEWGRAWPDYERYAVLRAKRNMGGNADVVSAAELTAADLAWVAEQRLLASEAVMRAAEGTKAAAAEAAKVAEPTAEGAANATEAAAQAAVATCSQDVALSWLQTEEANARSPPSQRLTGEQEDTKPSAG